MNKFENAFKNVLIEQDTADMERDAMEQSLDKDTDAESFDVDLDSTDIGHNNLALRAAKIKTAQARAMQDKLLEWVQKCDDFLEFLNGTTEGSIQVQLANAEPDTIFDRMKQSEQRKVARVATELAALAESFRGYVSQAENPSFKYV